MFRDIDVCPPPRSPYSAPTMLLSGDADEAERMSIRLRFGCL